MPKFHFNLVNCLGSVLDDEGRLLDDLAAAKAVAIHEIRSLICADAREGVIDLRSRIEIADPDARRLATVRFSEAVEVVLPKGGR